MNNRRIVIISGVSGSGKTSVQNRILESPDWIKPINFTTRKPRGDGELDEYCFLTEEQFLKKIKNRDFLEFSTYGGNFYGITKYLPTDKNIVVILDPIGKIQAEKYFTENNIKFETYFISISKELQLKRLRNRGDPIEEIEKRKKDFNWIRFQPGDHLLDGDAEINKLVDYIFKQG